MLLCSWDQQFSSDETNDICKRLASTLAARINAPHTRKHIIDLLDRNCFRDLCDYSPSYADHSVYDCILVRQITALYSKRSDLELGIDRRAVAAKKFIEAEDLCRETNTLLRLARRGEFNFLRGADSVFFRAQQKIAAILGEVPSLSDLKVRFGPGATTQIPKRKASPIRKLSQPFSCSEDLAPLVRECLEELPSWVFYDDPDCDSKRVPVEIHPGKLDFVPKNYKTDRAIVVEPMLNTMFQLGIGDYIAQRLKKFGIDISDQSRNQRLALEGSLTGALATLDLSSASDTIALELIHELLPVDWALFLSHFRSARIEVSGLPGRTIYQEKFSSMGNGFTFPLETLIFFALASACCEGDPLAHKVSAYGDDLIVPSSCFDRVLEGLRIFGFMPNPDKSFATGFFRESCGADYLKGINIRPVYLKAALSGQSIFTLHNFFVRAGDTELASILLDYLDPSLKKWGPDGYGDGHLISDRPLEPYGRESGWSGYVFETYTHKPKKDFTVLPGDRVYPFYVTYLRECNGGFTAPSTHSEYLAKTRFNEPSYSYDRRGRIGVTIPGTDGYSLIKIYTLTG